MKKDRFVFSYSPPKRTWIFLLYFALLTLVHSWIGEDFLITVRSILNFIHGFGPVYNIGERVQAYTHPLWFFLMSGVIVLTKEIFYSAILISVLFSFLAVLLMSRAHEFEKKHSSHFIAFVLFITFSSAFMDYTSSGLENPLGYLLFSVLVWCFYKNHYFYLPLLAALLFLTRYDYLFIFVPFLIFYLIQPKQWKGKFLSFSISGFIVLSWLVFSLYYYGSLFPSTYYAKTVGLHNKIDIFTNTLNYYKATMLRDFLTFLPFIFCFIFIRSQFLNKKDKLIVFSVIPYLLYIFWIGGDFMQGRFLAIPFFLTAPVFIKCLFHFCKTFFYEVPKLVICICLLMEISSLLFSYKSFPIVEFFIGAKIYWSSESRVFTLDERAVFFDKSFNFNERMKQINESYERWEKPQQGFKTNFFCGYLGISGLIMGKESHVVDYCGLSDFFLATLKPFDTSVPGHYERQLPLGYLSTILSKGKVNYICDKNIKEHWENIKEKIREPPKTSNLWKNLKDSFKIKQKAHAIPNFRQTLADDEDCARNLKNLFIQELDKKAFLRQYPNVFGWIRHPLVFKDPRGTIKKNVGKVRKYISDHVIFDLSAQVAFGAVKTQCFNVVLDSFSDFTISFVKDGKPFEKVYLTPKKRDSYIRSWETSDSAGFVWSVYKVCLKETLETDNLVIRLNCDPTIERFCYIHSISEISKKDSDSTH